jgi:predicted secreted Zn-dependent protease
MLERVPRSVPAKMQVIAGIRVKIVGRHWLLALAACSVALPAAGAEWQAVEQVKSYPISGTTGIELYTSIGERGPLIGGKVRAVAHTDFKLTWTRNYVPQGDVCTLVSAKPKLIITYTLPKPSKRLPEAMRKKWDTFYAGIRDHEKVHGEQIKEMVDTILKTTVGVSVPGDPNCKKIREEIKKPLSAASLDQRQKSRDFDRVEMGDGGNIQQLILRLVNP